MKTIIALISALSLLNASHAFGMQAGNSTDAKESFVILSSPDMTGIAATLAERFTGDHPGIDLSVEELPVNGPADLLENPHTIALVSKQYLAGLAGEQTWSIAVGKDVLVPVMNAEHPFREVLLERGISPEEFAKLFTAAGGLNWGTVLDNGVTDPVRVYVAGGPYSLPYLTGFTDTDTENLIGLETIGTDEMMNHIRKDRYAIGFCRLADITGTGDMGIKPGISLIPVDRNGDDKVDYFEDIYHSTGELTRGIWIGKYPAELYSKVYLVAGTRPEADHELAFVEWVLTGGQQYLPACGLTELVYSEQQSSLQALRDHDIQLVDVPVNRDSQARIFLIVIGVLLLIGIVFYTLARIFGTATWEEEVACACCLAVFGENSMKYPGGVFFDTSHTWTFMEKDGRVRAGIDDFLQHVTGPITKVKLKKPGDRITKGEPFMSLIQRGKQLDIQSPVSGIIREHNTGLIEDPEVINEAPFSDGWVYVIEPVNWLMEMKGYIMGDRYREWLKTEFSRLKDFLASGLKPMKDVQPGLILQDGGEIKDGVLEYFGPEAWEEFQSGFLHTAAWDSNAS